MKNLLNELRKAKAYCESFENCPKNCEYKAFCDHVLLPYDMLIDEIEADMESNKKCDLSGSEAVEKIEQLKALCKSNTAEIYFRDKVESILGVKNDI